MFRILVTKGAERRVGDWRVFYDVDGEERRVYVRAVRRKPPHRTTEEIL